MPDSQLEHVGGYTLEEVAASEAEVAFLFTNELRALSSSYLSFNFPVLSAWAEERLNVSGENIIRKVYNSSNIMPRIYYKNMSCKETDRDWNSKENQI